MGIISLAYQLIIFYKLVAKGVCYSNKHNHLWKGFWKKNAIKNCVYNFEIGDVGCFFYAWDWSWQHALDNNLTTKIAKFYQWIRDEHFCILSMIIKFLTILNQEYVFTLSKLNLFSSDFAHVVVNISSFMEHENIFFSIQWVSIRQI